MLLSTQTPRKNNSCVHETVEIATPANTRSYSFVKLLPDKLYVATKPGKETNVMVVKGLATIGSVSENSRKSWKSRLSFNGNRNSFP